MHHSARPCFAPATPLQHRPSECPLGADSRARRCLPCASDSQRERRSSFPLRTTSTGLAARRAERSDHARLSGHENPHGRNRWSGRVVAGHLGQGFLLWRTQSGRPFWTMRCERVLVFLAAPATRPGCAASTYRSLSFAHAFSVSVLPDRGGDVSWRRCSLCAGGRVGRSAWICTAISARSRSARRDRRTARAGWR